MSTPYTESQLYKVTRYNYRERRTIHSNGKLIYLSKDDLKREYLGFCEICGKNLEGRHKCYHHWDNEMPAMGIWVCNRCHDIIGGLDNGVVEKYIIVKAMVEKEYAIKQLEKIGLAGMVAGTDRKET